MCDRSFRVGSAPSGQRTERVVTHEGEIDVGMDENKAVVRQYLTAIHAAPPDLTVFDELLAPDYQGDRAGQKAFCSADRALSEEQIRQVMRLYNGFRA